MRLPKKPLNANMKWPDPPGTLRWLGVAKDQAACTAYVQAAANVRNSKNNLDDDLVSLDAARIAAAQAGADTSQLDAQRVTIVNAQAAAQAQIDDLSAKAAAACQEVKSGPPGVGCKTGDDCAPGQICVNGNCVDCPGTQVRNAQGVCAEPVQASATGSSNWGLLALAAAAVGGIFIASRGQLKELGQGRGNQYRSNPARKNGAYVVIGGHEYPVSGKKQRRTAAAALARAGRSTAAIDHWDGFQWSQTGLVLHARK